MSKTLTTREKQLFILSHVLTMPLKASLKTPFPRFGGKKAEPKNYKLETRLEHLVYLGKFIMKTAIAYSATYKVTI